MRNPYVSADLRIKVALAAAPFVHAKLGNAPSRLRVTQGIETPPRREYSEIELARRVADLLERGSAAVDKAKADLAAGRISAAEYERIMGNGDCSVGSTSPTADESLRPAVPNRSDPFRNN